MTSVAVIGTGMLGTELIAVLKAAGCHVVPFAYPEFDMTAPGSLSKVVAAADVIVNCAAYTAVDKAESEPETCRTVNAVAVGELGLLAAAAGKYVIHISTDFVFGDLTDEPQAETDRTNPLSVYGRTKLEGEQLLLAAHPGSAVIRVQWTYGANGSNFIARIIELAGKINPLKVVDDQIGAPTPISLVTATIARFIRLRPQGVFHLAAQGYASRCETAVLIRDTMNLKVDIVPCQTADFVTPAQRPLNSRFNCDKIDALPGIVRPDWQTALLDYLAQYPSGRKNG